MKYVWFDMDGTIANLYGVENWLGYLIAGHTKPYREAKPLVDMRVLARTLKEIQSLGYGIGVISWLSKSGTEEYNEKVTATKLAWLKKHLGSVEWNEINIVKYGTPKETYKKTEDDILFDDEAPNRNNWGGNAYDVDNILGILNSLKNN